VKVESIRCARVDAPSVCGSCDEKLIIGGPIWNGKIHDIDFVRAMHETCKDEEIAKKFGTVGRIKGILGGIIDEE
jgi:tRNA G26 N,N-dimethylase Trm1